MDGNRIEYIKQEHANRYIHLVSRLSFHFTNIYYIAIQSCNIKDNTMTLLEELFTNNIKCLYLDHNKIYDLSIFNKKDVYSNLEFLDLSFNNITNLVPLSKMRLQKLKELNLSGNQLKTGIEQFTSQFINNRPEYLLLEIKKNNNNVELLFEYTKNIKINFSYILENGNFNELLKIISFKGIKYLKLKGFDNDIHFLTNKTLQYLITLDLLSDKDINDLSMFNDINFINLEKIEIYQIDGLKTKIPLIQSNFDSLKSFKSIRVEKLTFKRVDDKYEFTANFCRPKLEINFNKIDFLYSDALLNTNYVQLPSSIFDTDGNSKNIFSYETLANKKFTCFKRIYADYMTITYESNIYRCYIHFPLFWKSLNFNFKDLSFFEINNDILTRCSTITLNNLVPKTFEKYNSLSRIELNNIYIENINIISKIYNISNIICRNVKCNPNIIDSLESYYFEKTVYTNKINYKKNKNSNFEFDIEINKSMLLNIKSLKDCIKINLDNLQISSEELKMLDKECFCKLEILHLSNTGLKNMNFLTYDSLVNLNELYLSKNQIEDISLLTEDKIKIKNIEIFKLNDNPIRKGLEVLKQNFIVNKLLYYEINDVIKQNDNNEYKICLKINNPINRSNFDELYQFHGKNNQLNGFNSFEIDFYLNNLINLWNYIERKFTFYNEYLDFEKVEELNLSDEEFDTNKKVLKLLLEFSHQKTDKNKSDIKNKIFYKKEYSDEIVINLFEIIYEKGYNYLEILTNYDKIVYFERITKLFPFLNITSLTYFTDLSNLSEINLTYYKINDIKIICGDVPFIGLRKLEINRNSQITNLNELKNAKFVNLKELNLMEDEIEDLYQIEMEQYPFENLEILNLKQNKIVKIEPILHFKNLKEINLRGNKVFNDGAIILVQNFKCLIDLRGNYANLEEIKNNCGEVPYLKLE